MKIYKKFNNGLKAVINRMEGLYSVSCGIMVKTGSINETEEENGISHFIEHVMFKGTNSRSAFEISDRIDSIGAQINAYTAKELTCYYTKSTKERLKDAMEVLSDIFFNSVFDKNELEKEKGVVLEEINMCEDTPEEICFDLLSKSYHGEQGLGRTILGSAKNIKRFTKEDVVKYMDKYYTADNVVISVAGNVDLDETTAMIEELFVNKFSNKKSAEQKTFVKEQPKNLYKSKKIEQTHVGIAMPGVSLADEDGDAFSIANTVLGGGMSSRLFQKIREELGLAYSVYSYPSSYKDEGVLEIYAGVNTALRDLAVEAIAEQMRKIKKDGITESEFFRAKEQLKSSTMFNRESTSSQMLVHGKYLIYLDKEFDYDERVKKFDKLTLSDVNKVIDKYFDIEKAATATIGSKRTPIKI